MFQSLTEEDGDSGLSGDGSFTFPPDYTFIAPIDDTNNGSSTVEQSTTTMSASIAQPQFVFIPNCVSNGLNFKSLIIFGK